MKTAIKITGALLLADLALIAWILLLSPNKDESAMNYFVLFYYAVGLAVALVLLLTVLALAQRFRRRPGANATASTHAASGR